MAESNSSAFYRMTYLYKQTHIHTHNYMHIIDVCMNRYVCVWVYKLISVNYYLLLKFIYFNCKLWHRKLHLRGVYWHSIQKNHLRKRKKILNITLFYIYLKLLNKERKVTIYLVKLHIWASSRLYCISEANTL